MDYQFYFISAYVFLKIIPFDNLVFILRNQTAYLFNITRTAMQISNEVHNTCDISRKTFQLNVTH